MLIIWIIPVLAQTTIPEERITIITYYPAPYGVYNELRARRVAIGDNYIDSPNLFGWDVGASSITPDIRLQVSALNRYVSLGGYSNPMNSDTGVGLHIGNTQSISTASTGGGVWWQSSINGGGEAGMAVASTGPLYLEGDSKPICMQNWGSDGIELGNVGIGTTDPRQLLSVESNKPYSQNIASFFAPQLPSGGFVGLAVGKVFSESVSINYSDYLDGLICIGHSADDVNNGEGISIIKGGNVGIGTINPLQKLHIKSDKDTGIFIDSVGGENSGVLFSRSGSYIGAIFAAAASGGKGLVMKTAAAEPIRFQTSHKDRVWISKEGNVGIGISNPEKELDIKGDIRLDGTLFCSTIKGDIAENIKCEECEPGDVVVVGGNDDNEFKKNSEPYSAVVAGVISEKPSLLLGEQEGEDLKPLALDGIVDCKIVPPVKKGDILVTSSKLGYAMRGDVNKITIFTQVVGIALEDSEEGKEKVEILIK